MKVTSVGTDRVGDGLELADISPERFGRARSARLSPAERRFYRCILRQFANSAPPSAEATRSAAEELALVPEQAQHSDIRGAVIAIPEAIEVGRAVFGDALRED